MQEGSGDGEEEEVTLLAACWAPTSTLMRGRWLSDGGAPPATPGSLPAHSSPCHPSALTHDPRQTIQIFLPAPLPPPLTPPPGHHQASPWEFYVQVARRLWRLVAGAPGTPQPMSTQTSLPDLRLPPRTLEVAKGWPGSLSPPTLARRSSQQPDSWARV
uniref:Uncharacterized protein n=1 Tax=Auxenochlorella protothecoides TaxID=3075 RepID=A0A1D1ZPC8_AUXPR